MAQNIQTDFELNRIASGGVSRDMMPLLGPLGDYRELKGKDAIVNQIRNLLLCPKGTYPFDPNYGSELYKQVFEPMNESTKLTILYDLEDCIEEYISGVVITSISVDYDRDRKTAYVILGLQIKDEQNETKLSLDIRRMGDGMFDSRENVNRDDRIG